MLSELNYFSNLNSSLSCLNSPKPSKVQIFNRKFEYKFVLYFLFLPYAKWYFQLIDKLNHAVYYITRIYYLLQVHFSSAMCQQPCRLVAHKIPS